MTWLEKKEVSPAITLAIKWTTIGEGQTFSLLFKITSQNMVVFQLGRMFSVRTSRFNSLKIEFAPVRASSSVNKIYAQACSTTVTAALTPPPNQRDLISTVPLLDAVDPEFIYPQQKSVGSDRHFVTRG